MLENRLLNDEPKKLKEIGEKLGGGHPRSCPQMLAKLAVSEKEWADYVQTTCSLKYVDMTEDSAYGMLLTQCENDKIVERINELIKIYNTFLSLN